ncbi:MULTISPECIES: Arc family DNA-binding protein [Asaia]|uniref:Arc family DNA-binding protein n=1 Tax=Asaia TaxID=91914 RepID=UPI00142363FC|nr:Arc family DNA-binding protein [Asaia sp. As-1742]NIE81552.1 Arc family DNA-binding protein [Asaia sp. As-1742]
MSEDDRYRRFNLRIPKEDFSRLQEAADARSHSMNAEIVQRLEASLSGGAVPDVPASADLAAVELALIRMWRAMNDGERNALAVVAEQLAGKARHGDVS